MEMKIIMRIAKVMFSSGVPAVAALTTKAMTTTGSQGISDDAELANQGPEEKPAPFPPGPPPSTNGSSANQSSEIATLPSIHKDEFNFLKLKQKFQMFPSSTPPDTNVSVDRAKDSSDDLRALLQELLKELEALQIDIHSQLFDIRYHQLNPMNRELAVYIKNNGLSDNHEKRMNFVVNFLCLLFDDEEIDPTDFHLAKLLEPLQNKSIANLLKVVPFLKHAWYESKKIDDQTKNCRIEDFPDEIAQKERKVLEVLQEKVRETIEKMTRFRDVRLSVLKLVEQQVLEQHGSNGQDSVISRP